MKAKKPKPANRRQTGKALVKRRTDGTFAQGVTGNPNGRPKVAQHLVLRARHFLETEGLDFAMAEVRRGGEDWARALALLAAYGMGKPPEFEAVEAMVRAAETDFSSGFDAKRLTAEERTEFRRLLMKGYPEKLPETVEQETKNATQT